MVGIKEKTLLKIMNARRGPEALLRVNFAVLSSSHGKSQESWTEGEESPVKAEKAGAGAATVMQLAGRQPAPAWLVLGHCSKALVREGRHCFSPPRPLITHWLGVPYSSVLGDFERTYHQRPCGGAFWGFNFIYIVFFSLGEEVFCGHLFPHLKQPGSHVNHRG